MNYIGLPHGFPQGSALRRSLLTLAAAALLCSAAISCGDDDPEQTPIAGASGGGSGGAGGMAGSPAGAPAPEPVACGTAMCVPRPSPLTALLGGMGQGAALPIPTSVACCIDAENGVCGTAAAAGATCEVAATPDTRCPGIDLGALGAAAGGFGAVLGNLSTGCCTPSGQCGLDGSIFGRGCVANGEARAMLGGLPIIGTLIPVPPSLACDRPLDDAGVEDAGI